jgi:hypothetical protein
MTCIQRFLFLFALVATFCFPVSAQTAQAKFTLTQETQFGKTSLPPGEYLLDVVNVATPTVLISPLSGRRATFFATPSIVSSDANCNSTTLSLKRHGSAWQVTSVCFSGMGMKLYFPPESTVATLSAASPKAGPLGASQ